MNSLHRIKATPKNGQEVVTYNGTHTQYTLNDFWRWSLSDLVSNTNRGLFAEFIVGTAINFDINNPRQEWEAFDLLLNNEIKIEVKSSAYIQSWNQKKYSSIVFSIKPSKYWDTTTNLESESKRHSDVYVFCHLKHKDQETINPLKLEQWDFYVVPTSIFDSYEGSKTVISLKGLQSLTTAISYCRLKEEILKAYRR